MSYGFSQKQHKPAINLQIRNNVIRNRDICNTLNKRVLLTALGIGGQSVCFDMI